MPLILRQRIARRLATLAVVLIVVVTVSAPTAVYLLGLRTLRIQAHATASQVSALIGREAGQRPRLWEYDSLKLLGHIRAHRLREDIAHIELVDAAGVPLAPEPEADLDAVGDMPMVWAVAPIELAGHPVGAVWVGASTTGVRTGALAMLVPFGVLALVLAGMMYWFPLAALERADRRIGALIRRLEGSQRDLQSLNETLEQEVERRAAALRNALRDLREVSSRAVRMQEAERRGLARDLHDSAGQALTAIRINLQLLGGLVSEAPGGDLSKLVRRTTDMVDDTLEEVRRAVNRLGPAVLDDVGLGPAVERICDDLADAADLEVECQVEGLPDRIDPAVETTCYRIVQESLTNVARHADASRVRVAVRGGGSGPEGAEVEVEVRDDGRGFDPHAVGGRSHGLVGMRERVDLLGGVLEIRSEPGDGTRISARVPVPDRAHAGPTVGGPGPDPGPGPVGEKDASAPPPSPADV